MTTTLLSTTTIKHEYEHTNSRRKKELLEPITAKSEMCKKCRLCLKPGNQKIFGCPYFDFALNIENILGIRIIEDDNKPQYICRSCEIVVMSAAELKEIAETTQWRLQEELNWYQNAESTLSTVESIDDVSNTEDSHFALKSIQIGRKWICRRCRETFNVKEDLEVHKRLLTCIRRPAEHVCEMCGLKLKFMSRLKRHRLIHTGELPYPCASCPYRGRTKYSLAMHERTHSGDRPLCCPDCPATFRNSSNLAAHRRSHLPPKYICDECQKGFKFREALQNHVATQHSNNKSYICSFCGKAYATRKMFRRHEIEVHNCPKKSKGKTPTYIKQQDP